MRFFVEKIAQYIRAFHLHDNDGASDTHLPVKPGTWVFDILNKPEFVSLPIIIESKFKTIDDLSQHVAWLKKELGRE